MRTKPKTHDPFTAAAGETLLGVLKSRFAINRHLHLGIEWSMVEAKLAANPAKLGTLEEMERSGGEPDVVGQDAKSGEFWFFDSSAETPLCRRSAFYDREGLESRKEHKPATSAVDAAAAMGAGLLTEDQYRELQSLGNFDSKTSSWLATPTEIRKLGGAIFGDRRFGRVFVYHNVARSYYSGRGFRTALRG